MGRDCWRAPEWSCCPLIVVLCVCRCNRVKIPWYAQSVLKCPLGWSMTFPRLTFPRWNVESVAAGKAHETASRVDGGEWKHHIALDCLSPHARVLHFESEQCGDNNDCRTDTHHSPCCPEQRCEPSDPRPSPLHNSALHRPSSPPSPRAYETHPARIASPLRPKARPVAHGKHPPLRPLDHSSPQRAKRDRLPRGRSFPKIRHGNPRMASRWVGRRRRRRRAEQVPQEVAAQQTRRDTLPWMGRDPRSPR